MLKQPPWNAVSEMDLSPFLDRIADESVCLRCGECCKLAVQMPDGLVASSMSSLFSVWSEAYSPFMGLFVARISRGRTIRELILAGGALVKDAGHGLGELLEGVGLLDEFGGPAAK